MLAELDRDSDSGTGFNPVNGTGTKNDSKKRLTLVYGS